MNDVLIRHVRPGDETVLAHIQTASWKSAFRHILDVDTLERLTNPDKAADMYKKLLDAGKGHGYLLELEGKPHCIAWWDAARNARFAGSAELICIHSLQENRRKGYGSAMMERVLQDIRQAGFRKVMLWVFEKNTAAISFYEAFGFWDTGIRQDAFGAAEAAYEKDLGHP